MSLTQTTITFLLLLIHNVLAADFRFIPEHIFTMDVALICQPAHERLNLSAMVSIWEEDIG